MNIQETSREIHENAVNKGFWPANQNIGEKLMLIVSELGEAMEAHRKGKFAYGKFDPIDVSDEVFIKEFEFDIKDTFEDELADTTIRLFDLAYAMGIDIEKHIQLKNRYNKTREYLHGKKY